MIYSQYGVRVTAIRAATEADIRKLALTKVERKHSPDGYAIVRLEGYEDERLYLIGGLRADGGSLEIEDALRAVRGAS